MFKVRKKVSTKIKPNIINMMFFLSFQYDSKEEANKNFNKDREAFIDKLSGYKSIASIFFFNRKISYVNKKIKVEQEVAVTVQDVDVAKDIIKDFHDSKSVTVNITDLDFLNKQYIEKKLLEQAFDAANHAADIQKKIACLSYKDAEKADWDCIFDEDQINFDFFNIDSFNKINNLQDKLNMLDGVEKEIFLKLEVAYNLVHIKLKPPPKTY